MEELFDVPSDWLPVTAYPVNAYINWRALQMPIEELKRKLAVRPPAQSVCHDRAPTEHSEM